MLPLALPWFCTADVDIACVKIENSLLHVRMIGTFIIVDIVAR